MDRYPQELKDYVVERMLGPDRASAHLVARETGLGATTVSRWRDRARSVAAMNDTNEPNAPPPPAPRRPQDWTAEERLSLQAEAAEGSVRGLRLDLPAVLLRHGVRLDVGDMDGSGLAAERRRRGLTVRRVAARARLPVETVMALEGPDAGECSIDELGAYAAAVGVRLGAAVRFLDVARIGRLGTLVSLHDVVERDAAQAPRKSNRRSTSLFALRSRA